jgi:hypothetical protein
MERHKEGEMAPKEETVKVRAADGTETRMRRADAEAAGLTVVEEDAPAAPTDPNASGSERSVVEESADASADAQPESDAEPE